MSIDRIATAQQSSYFLNQINQAGAALDKTQEQIASTRVSDTYAGFGSQAQVLTATISANARNDSYGAATTLATTQADMQDTQLSSLSDLMAQLKKSVSDAVANNDASNVMTTAQSVFEQASAILNAKDSNGDYIYSGGKTNVAPLSISSLSDLAALPDVGSAFTNGNTKKSVQVADGVNVTYGVLASDAGAGLMSALKSLVTFDQGATGNLASATTLNQTQSDFLTGQIATLTGAASNLTTQQSANGSVYTRLTDATTQQGAMNTLYKGFIGGIQNTNMADAATQLSLNQTALQAALQVTATLHQLSLLNYLPTTG